MEVFKLVKDLLETGLTRENINKCLGELVSNKSGKHTTINSRESVSLQKDEINHNGSNNNDKSISYDNNISHDDTCVLKKDLNSHHVKCIRKLQIV